MLARIEKHEEEGLMPRACYDGMAYGVGLDALQLFVVVVLGSGFMSRLLPSATHNARTERFSIQNGNGK